MNPITYDLWHERYDGRQDHDKLLGVYSTEAKAQAALELRDKPGFRDHPEGFDIHGAKMDKAGLLAGFVSVWGDEDPDPDNPPPPPGDISFPSIEPIPDSYWVAWHRYTNEWDIRQEKLIGVYTCRDNAEKAIDLIRAAPGFCDRPDGFTIEDGKIDHTDMANGFVTVRDGTGEHDEPVAD